MNFEAIFVLIVCFSVGYVLRAKKSKSLLNKFPAPPQRSFLVMPDEKGLTSYIDKAEAMASRGQKNISVVRTSSGILLLTDYERTLLVDEIIEVYFQTEYGFTFSQASVA